VQQVPCSLLRLPLKEFSVRCRSHPVIVFSFEFGAPTPDMIIELQDRPRHNRNWGRPPFEALSFGPRAWAAAPGALYVLVAWRDQAAGNPQFTLSCVEAGGPPVSRPERSGFGTTEVRPCPAWSWIPRPLSFTHSKDYAGALSVRLRECLKSHLILRPRARPLQRESHESTSVGGRG
jgi:hypothetical protein